MDLGLDKGSALSDEATDHTKGDCRIVVERASNGVYPGTPKLHF